MQRRGLRSIISSTGSFGLAEAAFLSSLPLGLLHWPAAAAEISIPPNIGLKSPKYLARSLPSAQESRCGPQTGWLHNHSFEWPSQQGPQGCRCLPGPQNRAQWRCALLPRPLQRPARLLIPLQRSVTARTFALLPLLRCPVTAAPPPDLGLGLPQICPAFSGRGCFQYPL